MITNNKSSIILPPPNITGNLHMGHAFQQILMDIIARYEILEGKDVTWIGGADHAGIAGQIAFTKYCDNLQIPQEERKHHLKSFYAHSISQIKEQMSKLHLLVDWNESRFTLDQNYSMCTRTAFVKLYEDGMIYKGPHLVYFDPKYRTVISHYEVVHKPAMRQLYLINYDLIDDDLNVSHHSALNNKLIEDSDIDIELSGLKKKEDIEFIQANKLIITVATTRPESMFGDVALAVHPNDQRYIHFIGKKARIPLTDRVIPIISDPSIDMEFGTGCLRITPAHDFNDYLIAEKHKLTPINIINKQGTLTPPTPKQYCGLTISEARKVILKDLHALKKIDGVETYESNIPTGERSGALLEVMINEEWFVRLRSMSNKLIDLLYKGEMSIHPEEWKKNFRSWFSQLDDWCISRQITIGERIPAWYDEDGSIYVGTSIENVREKYGLHRKLYQEESVLDTWFSSCLWNLAIKNWHLNPEQDFRHEYLVTGFDILFFWIIRMSILSVYLTGSLPAKFLLVTGLVRDSQGKKMSKTQGNVIDPIHVIDGISAQDLLACYKNNPSMLRDVEKNFPNGIEKWGLDAFRLCMAKLATPSPTVSFDFRLMKGCKNLVVKLLNASKYVSMNRAEDMQDYNELTIQSPINLWIIQKYNELLSAVKENLKNFRFDLIVQELSNFTFNDFCNFYLELNKIAIKLNDQVQEMQNVAYLVFNHVVLIFSPLTPVLCEQISENLKFPLSCKINQLKKIELKKHPEDTERIKVDFMIELLNDIRSYRGLNQKITKSLFLSPQPELPKDIWLTYKGWIRQMMPYIIQMSKVETITLQEDLSLTLPYKTQHGFVISSQLELVNHPDYMTKLMERKNTLEVLLHNASFIAKASQDVIRDKTQELEEIKIILKSIENYGE